MKKSTIALFSLLTASLLLSANVMAVPAITGSQKVVTPPTLLDWPDDFPGVEPYLTEPTANRLSDLHGEIGQCDIVFSTAGNYHMALRELWQVYLTKYAKDLDIKTWYYTTSPPISPQQVAKKTVQFGNLNMNCVPQVAVGPKKLIEKLQSMGVTDGAPVKIIKNRGNVMFVKKGNPKKIKTVWDLGRKDVTLVTPHPKMEAGSFGNFSGTVYNVAKNDPKPPAGMTAEKLFDKIYNQKDGGCNKKGKNCSWVTGKRIMHREQPWAVASGNADAGLIFYHLALYFTRTFPDKFEIVPLGGTAEDPKPAKGNKVGVLQAVRIKGNWTDKQKKATEKLMEALQSDEFTKILNKHGMDRP
ncbi:MAG: substrate-binding domain-containing protein [Gammaproteobacteria bacterium]|nr:substrate-binding domain-containing protein [Gammaproteobacteria bacterium]MDH5652797.1 substrate-binding domain-containing protein [Gammaproteobacteria bacterium]